MAPEYCGGQNQGVQRQLFGGGGGGGQRVAFRDSFGTSQGNSGNQYKWTSTDNTRQQQSHHASGPPNSDLVNNLPKEIENCEKSNQWPFSCVCIEKDLPCLPDFVDWSPEELRFEAYTAMKSGDTQSYVKKIEQLSADYSNKRQILKNLTPALKQKLMDFIDEHRNKKGTDVRQSSFGGGSSMFGATSDSTGGSFGSGAVFGAASSGTSSTSSMFGGGSSGFGNSAGELFGQSSAGSSAFGSGSTFGGGGGGGGSGTTAFGGGSSTSSFGAPNSSHAFGSSTFGTSATPAATAPTAPTSTFGSGSSSAFGSGTNSVFGGKSTFGGTSATGGSGPAFGSSPTSGAGFGVATQGTFGGTGSSSFGSATQSAGFGTGAAPTAGNVFGGSAFSPSSGTSAFAAPNANPVASAFATSDTGRSQASGVAATPPTGFFSGTSSVPAVKPAVVPLASAANSRMYTPLENLTEEEKAQFSAPSFVLGKIPTKPPPRELING